MKKLLLLILLMVLLCVSCTSKKDPNGSKTYEVIFYDGTTIVSKVNVTNYNELSFPNMLDKTIGNDTFKFVGWDINNDNVVDNINSIESNMTFQAVYEKVEQSIEDRDYYITYHLSDTEEKRILFTPGITLEVPVVLEIERFFYYEDKEGNVYTDKFGNVLSYLKFNQDVELFPKIIHSGDDLQSLCLYSYPKSVVSGDELIELKNAITLGEVINIDDDTISYKGQLFEIKEAISEGNIFHNLTRIVKGETYYFRYEPLEFDVLSAKITSTQVNLNLVTKEVIDSISSKCIKTSDVWGEHNYYYVASKPNQIIEDFLSNDQIEIDPRYFPFNLLIGSIRESIVPNIDEIITKEKYASDFVMATTLLDIGYYIDNMFRVGYLTGNLENSLAFSDSAYIYDNRSNLTIDKLQNEHGLLLRYQITIKED